LNNKTEIDYLNYNDLNLVEEEIKECTDRANEAMSPQINKIIDGKSTQKTRSGKNLINPNLPVGSETKDGITLTNNGDSTYTVKGTATKTTGIDLTTQNVIKLKGGTYYTNSIEVLSGTMDGYITVSVKGKDDVTKFNYLNLGSTFKAQTKKAEEDLTIVRYNYYIESGKTVAFTFRVQLEEGSTATSFEQYGASPSPDYPSEIENMKGKNLFDGGETTTNNGITFTKNKDGTYNIKGTATAQANCYNFIDINKSNIVNGETYTLWQSIKIPGVYILIEVYNGNTWIRHMLTSTTLPVTHTANISGGNRIRLAIRVAKDVTVDVKNLQIQLEKGSVATRYVPYGNIQIVETGENLFNVINYNNIKTNTNHTTIIKNENSINFTSQVYSVSGFYLLTKDIQSYISNLDISKKYIISADVEVSDDCTIKFGWESDATFANIPKGKTRIKNKFTPTVPVVCYIINKSIDVKVTNIMVSLSDENYEPYTEEVANIDLKGNELCSLPNGTKDELIVKDGRAKIAKRIGKVVLNGSEDWHRELSSGFYRFTMAGKDFNADGRREILSNYFKYSFNEHKVGIGFTAYNKLYLYPKQDITTVDEFKTWLSTHNTTVQYELETPEEIDLGPLEVYFTYETKKWEINELPYIQEIDRIEKGIYNLGEKYNRPKGWLPTKEWITKDNLYPIKGFDYRDWNRWVNNLNIFTTDIVVKDTIWNGASFINWEQIGKDEWR
jgi:hypothetical protein